MEFIVDKDKTQYIQAMEQHPDLPLLCITTNPGEGLGYDLLKFPHDKIYNGIYHGFCNKPDFPAAMKTALFNVWDKNQSYDEAIQFIEKTKKNMENGCKIPTTGIYKYMTREDFLRIITQIESVMTSLLSPWLNNAPLASLDFKSNTQVYIVYTTEEERGIADLILAEIFRIAGEKQHQNLLQESWTFIPSSGTKYVIEKRKDLH